MNEENSWMNEGICRQIDPNLWFPDGPGGDSSTAKEICNNDCPVRNQCLRYAVMNNERHGIWGGLSWPQRRKLRNAYLAVV